MRGSVHPHHEKVGVFARVGELRRDRAAHPSDRDPCVWRPLTQLVGRRIQGGSAARRRSEEHTSELQSLMRISYAVFCLKKKNKIVDHTINITFALSQPSSTPQSQNINQH